MIGGASRNIGKTELSCTLINKFCPTNKIIGLKVCSIYPDDNKFHRTGEISVEENNFTIIEETRITGSKDTIRMKNAGASRIFYIRVKDNYLEEAINKFFKIVNPKSIIICESNSLRRLIKPGLFLIIKSEYPKHIKESAKQLMKNADMIIISDGKSFKTDFSHIVFSTKGWKLS